MGMCCGGMRNMWDSGQGGWWLERGEEAGQSGVGRTV